MDNVYGCTDKESYPMRGVYALLDTICVSDISGTYEIDSRKKEERIALFGYHTMHFTIVLKYISHKKPHSVGIIKRCDKRLKKLTCLGTRSITHRMTS